MKSRAGTAISLWIYNTKSGIGFAIRNKHKNKVIKRARKLI